MLVLHLLASSFLPLPTGRWAVAEEDDRVKEGSPPHRRKSDGETEPEADSNLVTAFASFHLGG